MFFGEPCPVISLPLRVATEPERGVGGEDRERGEMKKKPVV